MLNPPYWVSNDSISQLGHHVMLDFGSSGSTSIHFMDIHRRSARNPSVWIEEIPEEDNLATKGKEAYHKVSHLQHFAHSLMVDIENQRTQQGDSLLPSGDQGGNSFKRGDKAM